MIIATLPQTPIRAVGKKFNALFPLVNRLNMLLESVVVGDKIELLQIFFDTDIAENDSIQFLKLRDGILQVIQPFNWDIFSALPQEQQQISFLKCIQIVVNEVANKYKLDKQECDKVFKTLFTELCS